MRVRELMSSPAYYCRPTDPLARAAQLLWDHDCGMLPVVDAAGRVTAAITDRDICMGALSRGRTLADLMVVDSMSREAFTCQPDDDIAVAVQQMTKHQLRRLPVVDGDGRPLGMLSLNDLALAADHSPAAARSSLRVLAAACRRRTSVPVTVVEAPAATMASAREATVHG